MSGISKDQVKVIKPHLASDEKLKAADRVKDSEAIIAVSDRRVFTFRTEGSALSMFSATPLDEVKRVTFYRDRDDSTDSDLDGWSDLFAGGMLFALMGAVVGFVDSNDLLFFTSALLGIVFMGGAIWASIAARQPGEPYISISIATDRDKTTRSLKVPGNDTNVAAAISEVAGEHQLD